MKKEKQNHSKKINNSGYCKHGINHILPHDCSCGCCKPQKLPSDKIKVINTNNEDISNETYLREIWKMGYLQGIEDKEKEMIKEFEKMLDELDFENSAIFMIDAIYNKKTSKEGDFDLLIKESIKQQLKQLGENDEKKIN